MTDHLAIAVMKQAADLVARKQCLEAAYNYPGLRVFGVGDDTVNLLGDGVRRDDL